MGILNVGRLLASASALFTPLSLFSSGEVGAWYDPSDFNTMYQDSAGTTPVTAVEQPVGLILDKSKGLAVGGELVTNGTFDTDLSGWANLSSAFVWSSGKAASVGIGDLLQTGGTVGRTYVCTFTISAASGSGLYISLVGNDLGYFTNGTYTRYVVCTATDKKVRVRVFAGSGGEIDNISVKEIAGNHASQATSASRPVLSARYNLLTYTEQFGNAAWTALFVAVSANQTTDPLGGNTADKITTSATTNTQDVSQTVTVTSAAHTFSVYVKNNGADYIQLLTTVTPSANLGYVNFNLTNGTVGTSSLWTGSISSVGNGWFRVSAATDALTAGSAVMRIRFVDSASAARAASITGDGTSGIYVWGADLRVTNDGVGLPAYQRVAASTDYDTTGFPYYLRFDGTDDSLATASIDFSGTDKLGLVSGVRKLSDATQAMIAELSASSTTNAGAFYLLGPANGTTGDYGWRSKGTTAANVTASTYTAPITNVLTGIGDIAGDSSILRINGVAATPVTTDQGTGNFGNYPLYIGRRGGSTLSYNGRLYGLLVVGRTLSAAEISNSEKWMAAKTGVTL